MKVDTSLYHSKNEIHISCNIKNTGSVAGDEIAQLYMHDEVSSVITFARKLRGFARIHLQPAEEMQVNFVLHKDDLAILNKDMQWITEPGWFDFLIGASSEDIKLNERVKL